MNQVYSQDGILTHANHFVVGEIPMVIVNRTFDVNAVYQAAYRMANGDIFI